MNELQRTVTFEVGAGESIGYAASFALLLARSIRVSCMFDFNGIRVYALPSDNVSTVANRYMRESYRRDEKRRAEG